MKHIYIIIIFSIVLIFIYFVVFHKSKSVSYDVEFDSINNMFLSWGGINDDKPCDICLDDDGNAYVIGSFKGTISFASNNMNNVSSDNNVNIFIAKFDNSGTIIWTRVIDTENSLNPLLIRSNNNSLYIASMYKGNNIIKYDQVSYDLSAEPEHFGVFLLKCDLDGNVAWVKSWGGSENSTRCYVNDICFDALNNIYIVGKYLGSIDFNPGSDVNIASTGESANTDSYFLILNEDGDYINLLTWTASQCSSITLDNMGNIYIGGSYESNYGATDLNPTDGEELFYDSFGLKSYIIELDNQYKYMWAISWYNNVIYGSNSCQDICYNPDENTIYIAGNFSGTMDMDPSDDNFIVTERTSKYNEQNYNVNNYDIYIIKLSVDGSFVMGKSFGSDQQDACYECKILDNGNYVGICGRYTGQLHYNSHNIDYHVNSNGNSADLYTLIMDPNGGLYKLYSFGGMGNEQNVHIVGQDNGMLYIIGEYGDRFATNIGKIDTNYMGGMDCFLIRTYY